MSTERDTRAVHWARRLFAYATVMLVVSCGSESQESADPAPAEPQQRMPEVSAEQAGEAVSDAMLVASQALYLAIASSSADREVTSPDGRLTLRWSEDADFLTGLGTYEIELDGYGIADDDPFAAHYNGYSLTGTIRLESASESQTAIAFDLRTDHDEPDEHPVQIMELELGVAGSDDSRGVARVNGTEFAFDELADSF